MLNITDLRLQGIDLVDGEWVEILYVFANLSLTHIHLSELHQHNRTIDFTPVANAREIARGHELRPRHPDMIQTSFCWTSTTDITIRELFLTPVTLMEGFGEIRPWLSDPCYNCRAIDGKRGLPSSVEPSES